MIGVSPYCHAGTCPIKSNCRRYKENINRATELYLAYPPYNYEKNECTFFVGTMDYMRLKKLRTELNINRDATDRTLGESGE